MIALGTIFVSSFIIALSGAMMPGPLLSVTISESSHRGMYTGPLLILGHGLLELLFIILLMLGLGPFLKQDGVFIVIALTGSMVLMWMAYGMFKSLPNLQLLESNKVARHKNLLVAGVILSIANPYWTIWWVTIGLTYILHSLTFGIWGVVSFFFGHILADFVWYFLISAAIWKGRSFLSDTSYRFLIGACACVLVVFSIIFAYSGFSKFI